MFRFLKPKCWKWREDEGKTRETELNGWNHGCYSDRLKALFLSFTVFCSSLIGLHEPPIRILAQMAKNLQTSGLNNISFQHRCRINSNTTCVSFFTAWYQTKLAQFLFFMTTKITFFFPISWTHATSRATGAHWRPHHWPTRAYLLYFVVICGCYVGVVPYLFKPWICYIATSHNMLNLYILYI